MGRLAKGNLRWRWIANGQARPRPSTNLPRFVVNYTIRLQDAYEESPLPEGQEVAEKAKKGAKQAEG